MEVKSAQCLQTFSLDRMAWYTDVIHEAFYIEK